MFQIVICNLNTLLRARYGTFTIPAAEIISGKLSAVDLDSAMRTSVEEKAQMRPLGNVVTVLRDFVSEDSGLEDSSGARITSISPLRFFVVSSTNNEVGATLRSKILG